MKRRKLLQTASLAAAGLLTPVGWNSWVAKSMAQSKNRQRLVVVFLRGALDGLNVVIPHQDDDYYAARPTIAVPYPGEKNGVIDLDSFFGLHPALSDIVPLWQQNSLAFVHACGSPDETRSHFDAQDYMETGTPGIKTTDDGWMNRLLGILPKDRPTQALNVGDNTPRILQGDSPVASMSPGKDSARALPIDRTSVSRAFDLLYSQNDDLSKAYQEGREAREVVLAELQAEMMSSSRGAQTADAFVDDAMEVGRLMVGNARTQLAFMEIGGWDTHINQNDILNKSLKSLGKGLATLAQELKPIYSNTVIVVMSEFGRTVKENGNRGTDHGHGNVLWLLGGGIRGGTVHGEWQGLSESSLYEERDLPVTTDFREAIATILTQHMQIPNSNLEKIFPGYQLAGNLNLLG